MIVCQNINNINKSIATKNKIYYKQINKSLNINNTVKNMHNNSRKLPQLFKFLINDSCNYISGKVQVDDFVKRYKNTTKILLCDIKQFHPTYSEKFPKDIRTIKNLYSNCIKFINGKISKPNFDNDLEKILSDYTK